MGKEVGRFLFYTFSLSWILWGSLRTQEGKAIAKQQSGFREGRPNKYTKNS